jgi:hypothetical protein
MHFTIAIMGGEKHRERERERERERKRNISSVIIQLNRRSGVG